MTLILETGFAVVYRRESPGSAAGEKSEAAITIGQIPDNLTAAKAGIFHRQQPQERCPPVFLDGLFLPDLSPVFSGEVSRLAANRCVTFVLKFGRDDVRNNLVDAHD